MHSSSDSGGDKVAALESERDDLNAQLVAAKQQHLELLTKFAKAQEGQPEAGEFEALKSAKQALEKKFVEVGRVFCFALE